MHRVVRGVLTFVMAGCVLGATQVASAQQLLTFDEIGSPAGNPTLNEVICSTGDGLRFTSNHFHAVGPDHGAPFTHSGTTHLGFESGRGFPIVLSRDGAGTFSLFSLDAGEFYSPENPFLPDAQWITLTGHQADGGVVTHSFFLDGIRDGLGGTDDYEHFVLPPTFVNLRSVVFNGWLPGDVAGGLAFDNLEYQLDSLQTVPPCVYVSTLPTVSWVTPGGIVSGIVPLEVNATDNAAVASVTFLLNGVELATLTSAPYTFQWDTTVLADGSYTLSAEARDFFNNGAIATLGVTVQNDVVVSDGPHYVAFQDGNDIVRIADAPALSFGNGTTDTPMTIEAWVRPDSVAGAQEIVGKPGEYSLLLLYGTVMLQLRDNSSGARIFITASTGPGSWAGSWHHVAVTYDGRGGATASQGVTIYLDGVAVPVGREDHPAYVAMENGTSPLDIGRDSEHDALQYAGGIDELRLWNVLRTANQIQSAMGGELSGFEAGLVGYWRFDEGAGVASADDSPNDNSAALMNGTAWLPDGPFAPDTTAPQINGIAVSNVTAGGATITLTTNEAAQVVVSYTETTCPCTDVPGLTVGTTHAVQLTGLTAETTYYFTVSARDGANNQTTSATMTFTTAPPVIDVQPPAVAWVTPAAGAVAGPVTLEASASDDVGVVGVTFTVDGVTLGAMDTSAPYAVVWDSTGVADGAHTLTAEARDAVNNSSTTTVVVLVQNAPVPQAPHSVAFVDGNDYVRVADAPALSFGNGTTDTPMTIEAWVRPDSVAGAHEIVGKPGEYHLMFLHGALVFQLRDNNSGARTFITATTGLSTWAGSWHHIAVTYDGRGGATASQGVTVYLDGVAVPVGREDHPAYVAMANGSSPLDVGRDNEHDALQYTGGIDELRLWQVVRTAADIQSAMATELTGGETGLTAYWRFNEGSGLTSDDSSPGTATATLVNGTLWTTDDPLAPDMTAPQISNVVVSNVTPSGATVSFTTSEPTTGWISYVAGTACPCTDAFSSGIGTSHTITLTGLASDTLYQVEAKAHDAANNAQAALPIGFQTLPASVDLEAPIVAIDSPAGGPVAGSVLVQATASDNVGVTNVTFTVDGIVVGAPDTMAPYDAQWDTTAFSDGAHTIVAEARDFVGHVSTATVVVQVANAPVPQTPHSIAFVDGNDYVRVADAPALSFGNGTADAPMTIEAWVRPDSVAGAHEIVGKPGEYHLMFLFGSLVLQLRDDSSGARTFVTASTNLSPWVGSWHHVAVTYDGRGGPTASQGVTVYLDGVAVPVGREDHPAYVAMENRSAPLDIGRDNEHDALQYTGGIDEVRLWHVVRTPAEIQAAMAAELTGGETGLAAYWRFNEGSGTSAADYSAGSSTATLINGTLWTTDDPLAPDTTAPQISNVVVSNVTPSGVTVSFTTNELTTGWISYVAGTACPCTDAFGSGIGTTHTITLTGLASDTLYQVEAKAHDAANNAQAALPIGFQTLPASVDLEAPIVAIDSPTGGPVAGSVLVQATASDNVGVTSVTFTVDGIIVGTPDAPSPYSVVWDSTGVADGAHTIAVEARDAVNNSSTATVVVVVANAPVPQAPHFIAFDGGNASVRVADAPALSFGNGTADTPMTIETWVRPDSVAGAHEIVGKPGEYHLMFLFGSLVLQLRDDSSGARTFVTASTNLSPWVGSWHHVAVTYDGRGGATASQGVTVYLDGVAVPVGREDHPAYVAMENRSAPLDIGRDNEHDALQYTGGIDEVRLWHVVRTPAEIQAAMAAELTGGETGLAAYWRFNEGSGTTAADHSPGSSVATVPNGSPWRAGGPF